MLMRFLFQETMLAINKQLILAFAVCVSAGFFVVAVCQVDLGGVSGYFRNISFSTAMVGLGVFWTEQILRAFRWKKIVEAVAPVPNLAVGRALILGNAINFIAPAKLGEIARAHFLGRSLGISRAQALGTVALERIFDVSAVCLATIIGGWVFYRNGQQESTNLVAATLVLIAVLAMGMGLYRFYRWAKAHASKRRHSRVGSYLFTYLSSFLSGMSAFWTKTLSPRLVVGTLAIWIVNGVALYYLALSIGVHLPILGIVLLIGVSGLSFALPAGPAGIGVLQLAYVFAFRVCGASPESGFVAASLVQFLFFGSVILVALLITGLELTAPRIRSET